MNRVPSVERQVAGKDMMGMKSDIRRYLMLALAALCCAAAFGFEAERIFRPEIYGRGDANVRPQQPIDTASWIWFPGHDVWGGAVFSETRTDAAGSVMRGLVSAASSRPASARSRSTSTSSCPPTAGARSTRRRARRSGSCPSPCCPAGPVQRRSR